MSLVGDVRDALVTALDSISGLHPAKTLGQNIQTPMALVGWPEQDFHEAMDNGLTVWDVPVQVLVGLADNTAATELLESYMDVTGATSVKAAIESDTTLGGTVDDVTVESLARPFEADVQGGQVVYLAAEWTVSVMIGSA